MHLESCKLSTPSVRYCYGAFSSCQGKTFIYAYRPVFSSSWEIMVHDNKGKYVRTLPNWRNVHNSYFWTPNPHAVCTHEGLLYTMAENYGKWMVLAWDLEGQLIERYDVAINETPEHYWTQLKVSSKYIVLLNSKHCVFYTLRGHLLGSWYLNEITSTPLPSLAIHQDSIYIIESGRANAIHRYTLKTSFVKNSPHQNLDGPYCKFKRLTYKNIADPHFKFHSAIGLCVVSRFVYVCEPNRNLVVISQEGKEFNCYGEATAITINSNRDIANNLTIDGDVLWMFDPVWNTMHSWMISKCTNHQNSHGLIVL